MKTRVIINIIIEKKVKINHVVMEENMIEYHEDQIQKVIHDQQMVIQ